MEFRRSWFVLSFTATLACSGSNNQSTGVGSGSAATAGQGSAGQAGASGASGGGMSQAGTSGASQGGVSSGSGGVAGAGGGVVCCNAVPSCPVGEAPFQTPEACQQLPGCHTVSLCCSTIWCAPSGFSGDAGVAGAGNASGSGGFGGASVGTCVGMPCSAGNACVAYRTQGGAITYPDSSGKCQPKHHVEAGVCQEDFNYECIVGGLACGDGPITCACAQQNINDTNGTCPSGYPSCSNPVVASWLDPSAQLVCQKLAP
ncbi:MAG TPA: hypothetical protein VGI10_29140 [Polyangiaceae bacterium]